MSRRRHALARLYDVQVQMLVNATFIFDSSSNYSPVDTRSVASLQQLALINS